MGHLAGQSGGSDRRRPLVVGRTRARGDNTEEGGEREVDGRRWDGL